MVARKKISAQATVIRGTDETDGPTPGPQSHTGVKVLPTYYLTFLPKSCHFFLANLIILISVLLVR